MLGRGYSDNNHLSVLPALFAGLALVLEVLVFRSLQVYRESAHCRRDWVVDVAERISARPPLNDLPYVLCFQLAALFCMESIEQLAFGGKLLGGTAWLGGPVFFSLAMHAIIGVACTFAVARAMRAILKALARVIGEAIDLVLVAFGAEAVSLFTRRREPLAYPLTQSVHVRTDRRTRAPASACADLTTRHSASEHLRSGSRFMNATSLARIVFVLLAVALGAAPAAAAEATTGMITGSVFDNQSGGVVADARITAASPSGTFTAQTDMHGRFRLLGLAPDTYIVSVQAPGFAPLSQNGVTVLAGQSQSVTFTLLKQCGPLQTCARRRERSLPGPRAMRSPYPGRMREPSLRRRCPHPGLPTIPPVPFRERLHRSPASFSIRLQMRFCAAAKSMTPFLTSTRYRSRKDSSPSPAVTLTGRNYQR